MLAGGKVTGKRAVIGLGIGIEDGPENGFWWGVARIMGKRAEKVGFGLAIISDLAPIISCNRIVQGLIQSEGVNSKLGVSRLKTIKLPLCLCEENSPATTTAKIAYNQEIYVILVKPFFE